MTGRGVTRRQFVRGAAAVSAAGLLPGCKPTTTGPAEDPQVEFRPGEPLPWANWAGNHACRPAERWAPESEDELASRLAGAKAGVRPVGAGHSFSPIVPTDGTLVATDLLSGVVSTDDDTRRAEVWSGTRLHQLGPLLDARGHALPNLPDIDYQTIAGATATSTHGTGVDFGSLSAGIEALALATPSGEILECSRERNAEVFHAARCSVGALGVVTRLTLGTQPSYRLAEHSSFRPLAEVLEDLDRLAAEHRHFEFFALPHASMSAVIATDLADEDAQPEPVDPEAEAQSTTLLRDVFQLVGGLPGGSALFDRMVTTVVEGAEEVRVGPWYSVLTHDRIDRFREMEYTVPAEAGAECLREILDTISERSIPVVFPIEFRYVKQDDAWLSMFEGRDGCSISIHQFADEDHWPYFHEIEPIFWKYEGRPHWGKLHTLEAAQLAERYPHWSDFLRVREALDPTGKMLNDHLRAVFGVGAPA